MERKNANEIKNSFSDISLWSKQKSSFKTGWLCWMDDKLDNIQVMWDGSSVAHRSIKKRIRGKNVKSRWTHWSALLDEKMSRERENFPIIIILSEAKIWREVGQMRLLIFRCWHWQYKSDTESAAFKHVQPIRFAINIARCMHMCVGEKAKDRKWGNHKTPSIHSLLAAINQSDLRKLPM